MLPDEARTLRNAETLAISIAKIMENSGHEERALALRMLAEEQVPTLESTEAVNFLADAARLYGTYLEYVVSHRDRNNARRGRQLCQNDRPMETVEA